MQSLLELFKDAGLHARLDYNSNRIYRENGDKLFTDITILIMNSPLHGGNTGRFDVSITHCKAKDESDLSPKGKGESQEIQVQRHLFI